MKNMGRRLKNLEKAIMPAAETTESRYLQKHLEAAHRRLRECGYEEPQRGDIRLHVPVARKNSNLGARLQLARELGRRQSLFDQCQAVSWASAAPAERSAARAQAVELCVREGFASIEGFIQNCRDEGWLPSAA